LYAVASYAEPMEKEDEEKKSDENGEGGVK
jgi:hypothetical protein